MPAVSSRSPVWATTAQLAEELGISTRTLQRMVTKGLFKARVHWRPVNPTMHRSPRLWHRQRVAKLLWQSRG